MENDLTYEMHLTFTHIPSSSPNACMYDTWMLYPMDCPKIQTCFCSCLGFGVVLVAASAIDPIFVPSPIRSFAKNAVVAHEF